MYIGKTAGAGHFLDQTKHNLVHTQPSRLWLPEVKNIFLHNTIFNHQKTARNLYRAVTIVCKECYDVIPLAHSAKNGGIDY